MLGMFSLLPYLKGWEYKVHMISRDNIVRGAAQIEKSVSETGWLLSAALASTDCYGTGKISWQGADLETTSITFQPEAARIVGALAQDPSGWIQKYFRPNPDSSAGFYVYVAFTGGFQGSAWPYVPTIVMSINLPTDSTQKVATVSLQANTIAITNKRLWLKSLRSVLEVKGKIDPALLNIGLTQMTEDIIS